MKKLLLSLIACLALVLVPVVCLAGCKKKKSTNTSRVATKKYTINFVVKDMGYSSVSLASEGEKLTEPDLPKSSKYKFDCWCTDSELTQYFNTNTPITDNMTLYGRVYDSNLTIAKKGDHAAVTFCKEKAKTVNIPMRFRNLIVTEIDYAFHNSSIEVCTIPNNITQIGEHAFWRCKELISITISNGVKSIGAGAFSECTKLENIYIPNSVTSIGNGAFSGCSHLVDIALPAVFDRFYNLGCWNVKTVTINSGEICSYAFSSCSLPSVTINSGEICSNAFSYCSVTSVTINSGNICPWAFQECSGLTSVTIGSGVTSIGENAFYGCSDLTSITIPDSVTAIGDFAFNFCSGLTSVTIGKGVTSISWFAFSSCIHLALVVNHSDLVFTEGSSEYGGIAYYAARVYNKNDTVTSYFENDDNFVYLVDGADKILVRYTGTSTEVEIPNDVTEIKSNAFFECSDLTSITIPDSVTTIGGRAFGYCSGLTSVTIGSGVTSVGESAFERCINLTSITIPDSVTTIGRWAFGYCRNLRSITIPSSVTSIGEGAFEGRFETESIEVAVGNPAYDSRDNCNAIIETASNTLIAGCNNTVIPSTITSIGGGAFYGCYRLTSITIPDSVTTIGGHAFECCSNLKSITIPSSVTSIGSSAFCGCDELESIEVAVGNSVYDSRNNCNAIIETASNTLIAGCKNTAIPSTVTSIGEGAFFGCSGLLSITISKFVTTIDRDGFNNCDNLETVTIDSADIYEAANERSNIRAGGLLENATTVRVLKTADNGSNAYLNSYFSCDTTTDANYNVYTRNF